jgi:hypothetical protein
LLVFVHVNAIRCAYKTCMFIYLRFVFLIYLFFFPLADQVERLDAIRLFKGGQKDVLVATDVAGKGLDFPDIKHVINYDMPKEIEDYGR